MSLIENKTRKHVFRATELWNGVIEEFQGGVPLSRHRLYFKSYGDTFVGSEGVSWFHDKLREKYDNNLTRKQTLLLMKKFYKAGVFKSLEGKEEEFKDNRVIYKLGEMYGIQRKQIEIHPLKGQDVKAVWDRVFIQRFMEVCGIEVPLSLLDWEWQFKGHQENSLPPGWLLSAMECLVTWPSKPSLSHVSYPSFETDVFKLISDYYKSYCGGLGLLGGLYDLFVKCFIQAELVDYNSRKNLKRGTDEGYPYLHSESTENLLMEIGTPGGVRPRRIFDDSILSIQGMDDHSYNLTRYRGSGEYLETSFTTEFSPVTRRVGSSNYYAYENAALTLSPVDLINHPKYEQVQRRIQRRSYSAVDLTAKPLDYYFGSGALSTGLLTNEGRDVAIEAFRLLFILLKEKKHLEVLIIFMKSLTESRHVQLDVAVGNRSMVVNTFSGLIMNGRDEVVGARIVNFLMDYSKEIFDGKCLDWIKVKVDEEIRQKVGLDEENKENKSYCSKISLDEYEGQRLLGETAKSLRNLLDLIWNDQTVSEKDKKKRLRNFQKEYPHIYAEKFQDFKIKNKKSGILKVIGF